MLAYSGRGPFTVAPVRLDGLVAEMGDLLRRSIARNADLVYQLADGVPPVMADATQVRQLALNLLVNASDALGGRPGTICVRTGLYDLRPGDGALVAGLDATPGMYAVLEVSDTGSGMDRETQAKIFLPFFTTKGAGRGLGLSAALGIVRRHSGALRVISAPGEGTTFQVLLRPTTVAVPAEPAVPDDRVGCPRGGLVLVVDDEDSVRRLGRRVLERAGFEVMEVADGPDAIDAFAAAPASFVGVLLDVTLPTLDGLTVLERIRCIRSDVPVVVSSGWSAEEVSERIARHEGVVFLAKPYRAEALAAAFR
jgi:CheY-like chemotaxis protein